MTEINTEHQDVAILPTGDSCENCGSTDQVQKFRGSRLCKGCRNQWAEIR